MTAVKYLDEGVVEGWAVAYGSPSRLDRHGEYFSPETDFQLDMIAGDRPLLYHHGLGPAGGDVIGRIVSVERRPEGLWVKALLDRAGRWFADIKDMLAKNLLGFSSGSIAHLVKMSPDGHAITRWPLIEVSLTPSPADPTARIYTVKSDLAAEHFAALRGYSADDRDELRLIRAHLAGVDPVRGPVTPGMDGAVVIQRPPEVHTAARR